MTNHNFQLTDKIALVTGGAGLLGSAICKALSEANAKVYITDIDDKKGNLLCEKLRNNGLNVKYHNLDINSNESIGKCVNNVLSADGKIDIWVNNAYPKTDDWNDSFESTSLESLKKNIDMHLIGYTACSKMALEAMKKNKQGALINIGSIYGVLGPNFSIYKNTEMTMPASYSLIKGALDNFTRYLATYYAAYNIRANIACPGGIYNNQDKKFKENYEKLIPLGRMAIPEDIVGAIVFLASDSSSYITGQTFMIDGGLSAW